MSSFSRRFLRTLAATTVAGVLAVSGIAANPVLADDGPPTGFPTWADVQAAKGNVAATQAEATKISGLLDNLQTRAGVLGLAAVKAGADAAVAKQNLDRVTQQVQVLDAESQKAAATGAKYRQEAVAVAVQSYKTGGTSLGLIATLSSLSSQGSLEGLDTLHRVGEEAAAKQTLAQNSAQVATSLSDSKKAAEAERARLAGLAKTALDAAVAAQAAMEAQVASTKTQSQTLVAQLASLKNTTAAVEQKYRAGQEALAAYNAAQEAKRKAAAEEAAREQAARDLAAANQAAANQPAPDPVNGWVPPEVLLPNIPGGAVNDPGGAQSYASSQLASFGWGQGQFQYLLLLWNQESSWLTNATNPSSGAYGIAQSLPPDKYSSAGSDWLTNYRTQINWGLGYIRATYGSPQGAWAHEVAFNWY
jgi:septal ring factor EnvC (AmiA/AmiB activator)